MKTLKEFEYEKTINADGYDFTPNKTIEDAERKRQTLELDLAIAIQNVVAEWQQKTGLNVSQIIPHISCGYNDGNTTKVVVDNVRVVLDYKV